MEISIVKINLDPNAGGGGKPIELQDKSATITSNGVQTITPDDGYALSSVQINAAITGSSSALDFSVIGYDEAFSTEINAKYNADIEYSKNLYNYNNSGLMTTSNLFKNYTNLIYAPNIDMKWSMNASNMFSGCTNLQYVPPYNISNQCTNITSMFESCKSLKNIDCSNWDVSSVKNFSHCFYLCESLESIDCQGWDLSRFTGTFDSVFGICKKIKEIKGIENFDVSGATSFYQMFKQCGFTSLDLSKWNIASCTNISSMFEDCGNLTSIDLTGWDFSHINTMKYLFENCSGLTYIPVISLKSVTNKTFSSSSGGAYKVISGCKNLKTIGGFIDCEDFANFGYSDTSVLYNLTNLENIEQWGIIKGTLEAHLCKNLTIDSLMVLINSLYDYTSNGEVTSNTLKLGSTNLAKLSDEQKAIATNKGWTLT